MTGNTWPDGHRRALHQYEHEEHNEQHYPGTLQLCELCEEPTGRCEEDSLWIENIGNVCESCYGTDGDMSIREFGRKYGACDDGIEWAVNNCGSMLDVWNTAKAAWLIWIALKEGVVEPEALREIAVRLIRKQPLRITEPALLASIEAAKRYSAGDIDSASLYYAHANAYRELNVSNTSGLLASHPAYRAAVAVSAACGRDAADQVIWILRSRHVDTTYEIINTDLRRCTPCFKRRSAADDN
jgi:hypothetical protein